MTAMDIGPGCIVRAAVFAEPVEVQSVDPIGDPVRVVGKGLDTGRFYDPVLSAEQINALTVVAQECSFDGNARRFRLGIEALRPGLAHEYDPYFSLSIARVDPLSTLHTGRGTRTGRLLAARGKVRE